MLSAGVYGVQGRRDHGGLYSKVTATGPGLGIVVQNGSITGGTGRFAGATGSIRLEHDFNEATNVLKGMLAGMIHPGEVRSSPRKGVGYQRPP